MTRKRLAAAAATAAPHAAPQDTLVLPEFLGTNDLERLTGTKTATWRYWCMLDDAEAAEAAEAGAEYTPRRTPPAAFKIGRRRVWRKSVVLAWLDELASAGVS
jgi:prophage regulatory protein